MRRFVRHGLVDRVFVTAFRLGSPTCTWGTKTSGASRTCTMSFPQYAQKLLAFNTQACVQCNANRARLKFRLRNFQRHSVEFVITELVEAWNEWLQMRALSQPPSVVRPRKLRGAERRSQSWQGGQRRRASASRIETVQIAHGFSLSNA